MQKEGELNLEKPDYREVWCETFSPRRRCISQTGNLDYARFQNVEEKKTDK